MKDTPRRSGYYLVPNTPAEVREAEQLLHWSWSEAAKTLLTRYQRRKRPNLLSIVKLEQELTQKWGTVSPLLLDFQRELGGITYSTHGEDGDWATWGLTYVYSPEDFDEYFDKGDTMVFPCCDYNTARPDGYAIDFAGQLWDTVLVAESVQVEIERIAFSLVARPSREDEYSITLRDVKFNMKDAFEIIDGICQSVDWQPYHVGADAYGCIYFGQTGQLRLSHAFEDDTRLFIACSTKSEREAEYVYASIAKSMLPPLTLQLHPYRPSSRRFWLHLPR